MTNFKTTETNWLNVEEQMLEHHGRVIEAVYDLFATSPSKHETPKGTPEVTKTPSVPSATLVAPQNDDGVYPSIEEALR